jgi:DNA-binding response OmpR family regulator
MRPTTEPPRRPTRLRSRDASRPARILVADDDADFRGILADGLRDDGYDVVEENDGGRLLVRITAIYTFGATVDPIDLIISDVRMPVCSGLDILTGLRNAHWSTPVILMTGFDDDELRASAAHLGAAVLRKPFPASDLRKTVRELLLPPGAS